MSKYDSPDDLSNDPDYSPAPDELNELSDGEHTDLDSSLQANRSQRRRISKSPSPETPKRRSRSGTPKSTERKARTSKRKSSGLSAAIQPCLDGDNIEDSGSRLDKLSKRSIKDARSSSDPITTLSGLSSAQTPLPTKSPLATEPTVTSQAENLDFDVESGKTRDETSPSAKKVKPNPEKRGHLQQMSGRKRQASSPEQAFQGIPTMSFLPDSSGSGAPKKVAQSHEANEVSILDPLPHETITETRGVSSSTLEEDTKPDDDRSVESQDSTKAPHQPGETRSEANVPGKQKFSFTSTVKPGKEDMGQCNVSSMLKMSMLCEDIDAIKNNDHDRLQLPKFHEAHTEIARDMALVSTCFEDEKKYECSWNHVHWTIGRLATKAMNHDRGSKPTFGFDDVTTNQLTDVSKNMTDGKTGTITDFVITYKDDQLVSAMDQALERLGEPTENPINAITNLSRQPISVAIETKSSMSATKNIDGQTKKFALSSFARVYKLIEQRCPGPEIDLPPMPMLHVIGATWKFFVVTVEIDKRSDTHLRWAYKKWPPIEFGTTKDSRNIDKIVLMLQVLMRWTENEYMPWFSKHVCDTPDWTSSYQKRMSCSETINERSQHQGDSKTREAEQKKPQHQQHISHDLHSRLINTSIELALITWGFLCVLMVSWVWPFIRMIGSHISQLRARKFT